MFGSLSIGRERHGAIVAPIATGFGLLALVGLVAVVDPHTTNVMPACPFRLVTGWWCPACGMTRSVHHLTHGEIVASFSDNLFTIAVVMAIALSWWSGAATSRDPNYRPTLRVPRIVPVVIALAAVAYTVIRNLPSMTWLRGAA